MNWQYTHITIRVPLESGRPLSEELNKIGALGWEMVSVISHNGMDRTFYFKRPMQPKEEEK
jgi:hypothetical protein